MVLPPAAFAWYIIESATFVAARIAEAPPLHAFDSAAMITAPTLTVVGIASEQSDSAAFIPSINRVVDSGPPAMTARYSSPPVRAMTPRSPRCVLNRFAVLLMT